MAQSVLRDHRSVLDRQIRLEKVGVIAGFLMGLPLAVGEVSRTLAEAGAPAWLEVTGVAITLAATTRLGLMAATALSRKLNDR